MNFAAVVERRTLDGVRVLHDMVVRVQNVAFLVDDDAGAQAVFCGRLHGAFRDSACRGRIAELVAEEAADHVIVAELIVRHGNGFGFGADVDLDDALGDLFDDRREAGGVSAIARDGLFIDGKGHRSEPGGFGGLDVPDQSQARNGHNQSPAEQGKARRRLRCRAMCFSYFLRLFLRLRLKLFNRYCPKHHTPWCQEPFQNITNL